MVRLNSDPEVVRYTGDTSLGIDEAKVVIERLMGQFTERRIGRFVAIEKATGEKIGWTGLKWEVERKVIDLGYRFQQDRWGKGYATEASIECLRYGFDDLGYQEITAMADPANTASVHVLQKLGFRETARGFESGHSSGEFVAFAMTAAEDRALRPRLK